MTCRSSLSFSLVCGSVLGILLASCRPASAPLPELLRLELIRPKNPDGVYLNEELVFDFSADIDPLSVTKDSLRIETEEGGEPARGEFSIRGNRIRFLPDPVLDAELAGGGYRPGTRYLVTFTGFPRLDALRDEKGTPLNRTVRWAFTTAQPTPLPRTDPVLADSSPETCAPLRLVPGPIAPGQPILLACDEPLDPSSLRAEDFTLMGLPRGSDYDDPKEYISLRVSLVRNEEERRGDPNAGALIQLSPRVLLAEGGPLTHTLRIEPSLELVDFGGNRAWYSSKSSWERGRGIEVRQLADAGPSDVLRESFIDQARELPLEILGVDGTAMWNDSGIVTIRYPAAAGDGRDGEVRPEVPGRSTLPFRVQAFRAQIPESADVLFSHDGSASRPGLVLLRAQGKIQIDGRLTRRLASEETRTPMNFVRFDPPPLEAADWLAERVRFAEEREEDERSEADALFRSLSAGLRRNGIELESGAAGWRSFEREVGALSASQGSGRPKTSARKIVSEDLEEALASLPAGALRDFLGDLSERLNRGSREWLTLSEWLERTERRDRPWTVLIAGGDLVVSKGAVIESDTPILLCAGGRLRVYGQVRAPEIWILGEGGGSGLQGRQDAELVMDQPTSNPLAGKLRYAVLSQSLPSVGGPAHWTSARALGQDRGGRYTVHYLRSFSGARFDPTEHEMSYSPALMEQPARIRFLIELEIYSFDVGTGPEVGLSTWSPPFVDEIVLISENAR